MENKKNDDKFVDIVDLLRVVRKNIWDMVFFGILGIVVSAVVTFFFITPKYSSTVDILVNQKSNNSQAQYVMQQADLQAINTYKDILVKPIILSPVLNEVKKTDNYQGNLRALTKSVKISNQTNSQIVSVTVTDNNAYVAADIANTIGKVFSKKIKKIMQVDNVSIVSKAKVNNKPVSPRKKVNLIIGLIVGVFCGIIFILIKELTDKTVKDSSFVTDELGLTNIGSVYHLDINDNDYGVVKVIARNKISNNDDEELSTPRRRRV